MLGELPKAAPGCRRSTAALAAAYERVEAHGGRASGKALRAFAPGGSSAGGASHGGGFGPGRSGGGGTRKDGMQGASGSCRVMQDHPKQTALQQLLVRLQQDQPVRGFRVRTLSFASTQNHGTPM